MGFKAINPQQSLPEMEEEVLEYWQENKIFEKSIENRKDSPLYNFYDGPPFATGTPHYGHIVGSVMKDLVPRYLTMKGYSVPRVWGWDCHGLPIENIAEQELGIKNKKEIEELGVEKFNEVCRNKVLEYVAIWEKVIPRLGRWVDMKNAYRTMDIDFMESVWWVFKELWEKDLIYEGYRSMHICPRCETTLSQSEVAEGYRDIKDLSVVAKFELVNEKNTFILAWTTTPWTLLANVALAINSDVIYCKIKTIDKNDKNNESYIIAKDRVSEIFKDYEYEIIEEFKGDSLIDRKYKPLFEYEQKNIKNSENGWKIVSANFVSTEEGTGIVHIAPAFGEDDLNLGKEKNLPFIQHIGMNGVIKSGYGQLSGKSVKPAENVQGTDVEIIKYLAEKNLLFSKAQYSHSYPHCWRCETPLLNFATSSYFVNISKIKKEAIDLADKINWSPKNVKEGRFGKWLENARDWSISRQRFWASVIPVWKCSAENGGCGEIKVIGSIKELEDLCGAKITDIHKDKIDPITIACPKCKKQMRRIPDVLDAWFDSGSMPYAQKHYPFENKESFDNIFPAEFIGEGQDQTRCWFYYLHILSTALKNNIAYKNVVVNGIVLAEDGKKMSKRLKNYPDPQEIIDKYGADALRLYLLTSSVLQMENLNFKENDLASISRGPLRMLWNSYSFFVLYANIDNFNSSEDESGSKNILDKWILGELDLLVKDVNNLMDQYELSKASRVFLPFIDNLSNWYIRRSRKRFQKNNDLDDKKNAYRTLYTILVTLSKLLAPFTPFIAEEIYRNLTGKESVHLEYYPKHIEKITKESSDLALQMRQTRIITESGLAKRAELGPKYRVRQPLASATIKYNLENDLKDILADEINVKEIIVDVKQKEEIILDTKLTTVLLEEGEKNDLIRKIQDLRKKAGLSPADKIQLFCSKNFDSNIISKYKNDIIASTNLNAISESDLKNEQFWLEEK